MPATPATGATRRSIQGSLSEKLKEVTDLVNALNVEIFLLDEQRETVEAENEKLAAWLCFCPERPPEAFDPDEECPVHGDPSKALSMRAALAETERWRGAFEALHARILRDLPGDGSELAPPDDAFWAAQLDGLLAYTGELYQQTEGGNQ